MALPIEVPKYALGQTLRYYRGQFNPEAAYQGDGGGSGVISMYNPESQAQFIDAVAKRQERFDATKMAIAQEKARIGETETYDLANLTKRLNSFESGINNLVKSKYNGDYSAAANEIASMIGTERSNPFYHFNKQKVEMGKAYLDTKMKLGSKFMSAKSPFDVSFDDWQKGETFEFTPVNRDDIVKEAAMEFGSLAETIMNDPQLQSAAGGQYFLSTIKHGIKDPEQLREFMASPDGEIMINNIIERNPELAKLPREQVMGAVFEGAHAAIGKVQTQYLANQAYISPAEMAKMAGSTTDGYFNLITPSGTMATKTYFEGKKGNERLGAIKTYTINSTSPSNMTTANISQLNNIKENLSDELKILAFGDKPSELVNFINKQSSKNVQNMDGTKPLYITDIGFSPNTAEIVFGVRGVNKEGNILEAGITLNAGEEGMENTKILNILPYLQRLGAPDSEFNRGLYEWAIANYPQQYNIHALKK